MAWCSDPFIARHGMETPFTEAPELCVEVISPSNSDGEMAEKIGLYLSRGAVEVWLVSEEERVRVFGSDGELQGSALIPQWREDEFRA